MMLKKKKKKKNANKLKKFGQQESHTKDCCIKQNQLLYRRTHVKFQSRNCYSNENTGQH